MGLPRANRLKHRQDFNLVYQKGIFRRSSHLILRAILEANKNEVEGKTREAKPVQFGISIGKKVSKKAVVRNRIKRQIKAAISELISQISPGWKIVIVVLPPAIKCEYKDFLGELKQLLVKAEIIDGN